MGMLVEGQWVDDSAMRRSGFHRPDAPLRNWVTVDGSSGFKAEADRYHLYISYACPWAHRTLIVRRLKKLEDAISLSVVDWHVTDDGWHFSDRDSAIPDPNIGAKFLRDVYLASDSAYSGRVTVPILWDKQTGVIVNNESSEIIRMFNDAFNAFGDASLDLYPADKRAEIDALNDGIYDTLNNGVYKCGFGGGQVFYEESFDALFATLDDLERRLARQRYLVGDVATEADWRLFPVTRSPPTKSHPCDLSPARRGAASRSCPRLPAAAVHAWASRWRASRYCGRRSSSRRPGTPTGPTSPACTSTSGTYAR